MFDIRKLWHCRNAFTIRSNKLLHEEWKKKRSWITRVKCATHKRNPTCCAFWVDVFMFLQCNDMNEFRWLYSSCFITNLMFYRYREVYHMAKATNGHCDDICFRVKLFIKLLTLKLKKKKTFFRHKTVQLLSEQWSYLFRYMEQCCLHISFYC